MLIAESILKNRRGYGISQNPDTKVYILAFDDKFLNGCRNCSREYHPSISIKCCDPCLISDLKDNLTNWTSGDEKIDNFIKEKQLKIEWYNDKIFEWIPYDKFIKINEMSRESRFATALLKNGLLSYNMRERRMMRKSYEKVYLKYLHNPQIITDEFLDEFQLSIKNHNDTIFEWIPYNEFIDIKKTIRGDFITAIWKKGPSCYSEQESKYKRKLNAVVLLKNLYNSQNTDNTILNKIANSIKESYGLYQDPVTKDFILVLQPKYYCKICGMRLSYNYDSYNSNVIFEWIPYDQFVGIKEIGKGGFSTVYSAMWKDGSLTNNSNGWKRNPNTRVALKCLHNSQNFLDNFINKV
ncbi:hypothetical protein RclHR1_13410003 [Rhizophagus clarus]|uniref:Protein kinase domain-containing protein n=1 Tax=Rhizophagus clarus TaxID=94130 RepID=A0A2Z6Q9X8_9GLOM|nr:hypothetical protein RclHR1_13410003 [Rhizophagus clarus]